MLKLKGMMKRRNHLLREDFLSVIETQKAKVFTNADIIKETDSVSGSSIACWLGCVCVCWPFPLWCQGGVSVG